MQENISGSTSKEVMTFYLPISQEFFLFGLTKVAPRKEWNVTNDMSEIVSS